jgi:hypothetical protein
MMGVRKAEAQLFYEFNLESHVPADHLLREIDRFLDMDGMREKLRPSTWSIPSARSSWTWRARGRSGRPRSAPRR